MLPTDHLCDLLPLPMHHLIFEQVDALLNMHRDAYDVVDVLCYHSYCSVMM